MKHFPKKLFIGGLVIGGLILILGVFVILDAIITPSFHRNEFPKDAVGRIGPNGEVEYYTPPKNDTSTITEEKSTKSDDAEPYFEGTTIPKMTEQDLWVAMMTWHKYPQTVEALMDSYYIAYMQDESRRRIDKRVPPEQWLQYLLDKGVIFHNFGEYAQYMDARVVTDRIDNIPGLLQEESDTFGIPVSDIDRIKKRYLEHHLLFLKRKHTMERTVGEPVTGGIHIGDKVLPFYQNRDVVYVQRKDNGPNVQYFGTRLNSMQIFLLNIFGIEPKGVEVIYIDKLGNKLSK